MGDEPCVRKERSEAGAGSKREPTDADVALAARVRVAVARLARQIRQQSMGGLTPSQLSALLSVEAGEPIRLNDLAAREAVAPPTLTRIAAGLKDLGLVERRPDPADARAALIVLTPTGHEALARIKAERTALLVRRLARLPDAARQHLPEVVELLEALIDETVDE